MSYSDKNKIFFGLLHYIFSEQSNVNWAFRTSLVNFTGINETVSQRKYKNDSISNDIIKYIKDIKPYHVQFDHYIEKFTSKDDVVNVIPSDSVFHTINVRFDSVASNPDIDYFIYTASYNEPNTNIKKSDKEIRYLNLQEKNIYILKNNGDEYFWEYKSTANYNDIFYVEDRNLVGKLDLVTSINSSYNDIVELSGQDLINFENTSLANRIFLYKTHDLDIIKDYLNTHYKGLTITSGDFNIDKFGYDAFLYDLKRYEEPTKTCAYCLIDKNISQIPVGTNILKINYSEILNKDDIILTSSLKSDEITDYSLEDNIINLFFNTESNELFTIKLNNGTIIQQFLCNSFEESNDDKYIKKFIDINDYNEDYEYVLDIPSSSIELNKVLVYIEKPNGYRYPTQDFLLKDNKVHISFFYNKEDKINWKIYIVAVDYTTIYDKIYTWEDIYGISNNKFAWENYYRNMENIQFNTGNNFLDPYYNEDRPSELSMIYPQNTIFVYQSKNNESNNNFIAKKIYNFDFKNHQINTSIPSTKTAKLIQNFNLGDTEIHVSKDVFDKPYYKENKLQGIKIIINSEIIEFYDYEKNNDNSIILKKIRRGVNGTFINQQNLINSVVYPFFNIKEYEYNLTPSYYFIKNQNMKEFTINGNIPIKELVSVYKTNNIELLSEINENTSSFIISNDSVELPKYDDENNLIQKGCLFINGYKIFFNTYSKNDDGTITISNFNNIYNKSFHSGDQIYSNKFIKLSENDYEIYSEKYDELKDIENSKIRNYIILNNNPNIGESIIIENHNENVFE